MEIGNIIPHVESLIFASEKPLTALELTELVNNALGFMDEKLTLEQIQTAIDGIVEKYRSEFYPFEVRESGGGLQFLTKKEYHKTVAQLNGEKFLKRLSTAALETLSIIAYKQPVTKGEIEAIRGVSSDYAIQRLLEKELVVITGRNEKMPGHPLVYATSRAFMDYFGINSPADLPKLKEVMDEAMVNPTIMDGLMHGSDSGSDEAGSDEAGSDDSGSEANELLAVTQNGELTTARLNPDVRDHNKAAHITKSNEQSPDASLEDASLEDADTEGFTNSAETDRVSDVEGMPSADPTYHDLIDSGSAEMDSDDVASTTEGSFDDQDDVEASTDDSEDDESSTDDRDIESHHTESEENDNETEDSNDADADVDAIDEKRFSEHSGQDESEDSDNTPDDNLNDDHEAEKRREADDPDMEDDLNK